MKISKKKLKQEIIEYLKKIGYSTEKKSFNGIEKISKKGIRRLHLHQRRTKLQKEKEFVKEFKEIMLNNLASGNEINPDKIDPYLVEVKASSKESKIFRFATLNWSVPVSNGYGRRMRFLVKDSQNDKLIGIFALGDPVYNLKVRDKWIGWTQKTKSKNLIKVMDAYILGALPPYSNLIGGKLIASLITSKEVQDVFDRKYGHRKGKTNVKLAIITTGSALGKSSIYDRLKLNGELLFQKIGETKGYGHFHISDELFTKLKNFLIQIDHPYAKGYKYGDGANWRFRVIRKALQELGLNSNFLSHGIKREIYVVPLAKSPKKYLLGKTKFPHLKKRTVKEISEICKNRWIIPRSRRDKSYLRVKKEETLKKMIKI